MNVYRAVLSSDLRRQVLLNCVCGFAKKVEAGAGATIAGLGKKKKLAKAGLAVEKKVIPVETDPKRLVSHVCGTNLLKEGGQDVEVKPDCEYPDWLWTIRTGRAPKLEELDPSTKEYWKRARSLAMKQQLKLLSLRKF